MARARPRLNDAAENLVSSAWIDGHKQAPRIQQTINRIASLGISECFRSGRD
jgi:hypothetical protein